MSEKIELAVQERTTIGKDTKKLRRQGLVPGVIYGFNVTDPRPVQVDARLFERIYHRAGTVHLVDLRTSETGMPTRAFISAVKRNPITHAIAHVDFRVVNLRLETTAHVPIVLTGESPAVADDLGLLLQSLEAITVRVLPTDVPESISVDISSLTEVGSMIHVKDLVIPAGVTLMTDGEEVVARITAPTLVEEPETVEAAEGEAATDTDADATAEGSES